MVGKVVPEIDVIVSDCLKLIDACKISNVFLIRQQQMDFVWSKVAVGV